MQVGLRNNLPIMAPVDNAGVFTEEAGPFQGEPKSQLHQVSVFMILLTSIAGCNDGCRSTTMCTGQPS